MKYSIFLMDCILFILILFNTGLNADADHTAFQSLTSTLNKYESFYLNPASSFKLKESSINLEFNDVYRIKQAGLILLNPHLINTALFLHKINNEEYTDLGFSRMLGNNLSLGYGVHYNQNYKKAGYVTGFVLNLKGLGLNDFFHDMFLSPSYSQKHIFGYWQKIYAVGFEYSIFKDLLINSWEYRNYNLKDEFSSCVGLLFTRWSLIKISTLNFKKVCSGVTLDLFSNLTVNYAYSFDNRNYLSIDLKFSKHATDVVKPRTRLKNRPEDIRLYKADRIIKKREYIKALKILRRVYRRYPEKSIKKKIRFCVYNLKKQSKTLYQSSIKAYFQGDYIQAKHGFTDYLLIYPGHQDAIKYLAKSKEKLRLMQSILN